MNFQQAWRAAELRWRANLTSTFVAAYAEDDKRADAARRLGDRVFVLDPAETVEAREIVHTLTGWASDVAGREPPRPRPDERDGAIRDHVKDVLRDRAPWDTRIWVRDATLTLEVRVRRILGRADLGRSAREDVFYLHGRASMALQLGDRQAYHVEMTRLHALDEPVSGSAG